MRLKHESDPMMTQMTCNHTGNVITSIRFQFNSVIDNFDADGPIELVLFCTHCLTTKSVPAPSWARHMLLRRRRFVPVFCWFMFRLILRKSLIRPVGRLARWIRKIEKRD